MTAKGPYQLVIDQRGPYSHAFGHDPTVGGLTPHGRELPAHLVVSLDMRDPRLNTIGINVGPTLRLVHPYHYSQGETFTYRHVEDGIAFDPFPARSQADSGWPTENYPAQFPSRPGDLFVGTPDPEDWSFDKIFVWPTEPSIQPTFQDEKGKTCEACRLAPLVYLAVVQSSPLPGLELWGEYGAGVETNFWYCPRCNAINTSNGSD